MSRIIFIIVWIGMGLANIPLTAKYGNGRPIGLVGATGMVVGGPIIFGVIGVIALLTEMEKICVANCGAKQ